MQALIRGAGRVPLQRTTLYAPAPAERHAAADAALPLSEMVNPRASRRARIVAAE
jgi:hypothetical protein